MSTSGSDGDLTSDLTGTSRAGAVSVTISFPVSFPIGTSDNIHFGIDVSATSSSGDDC